MPSGRAREPSPAVELADDLNASLLRQRPALPRRRFSARQGDEFVERAPRDSERYRAYAHGEHPEKREIVKRPLDRRRHHRPAESAFGGDKDLPHPEVMAAAAAQSGRIPRIQDFHFARGKYHEPQFRLAAGGPARASFFKHGRRAGYPLAVLRATTPLPSSVDDVTSVLGDGFAARRRCTTGNHVAIAAVD